MSWPPMATLLVGNHIAPGATKIRFTSAPADVCVYETAGAQKALAIVADATDGAQLDAAIERTVAKLGGIDALVTLVGGSQPGGSADLSDADWRSVYDRNLWPAIRASRSALPHLELGAA